MEAWCYKPYELWALMELGETPKNLSTEAGQLTITILKQKMKYIQ